MLGEHWRTQPTNGPEHTGARSYHILNANEMLRWPPYPKAAEMDFAILGDSIAVGVSMLRTHCHRSAAVGINSDAYVRRFLIPMSADRVLISLGSNDDAAQHTEESLNILRRRVTSNEVTWLLSSNRPRAHEKRH